MPAFMEEVISSVEIGEEYTIEIESDGIVTAREGDDVLVFTDAEDIDAFVAELSKAADMLRKMKS